MKIFYFICIFVSISFSSQTNNIINLTQEELLYLENKKVLNVSNDANFPPYDFVIDGKATGYSVDYIRVLGKKLNLKLNFITEKSWKNTLQSFCDKKIDILHATDKSPMAKKCGNISAPQIRDNRLIVTRKNGFKKISSSDDLVGLTLVTPHGWSTESIFKKKYGDKIKYIKSKDLEEALELIRLGKADFTVSSSNTLQYFVLKNNYENLTFYKNDMQQSKDTKDIDNLYIASRNDEPLLQSIINKAMNSISIDEKKKLRVKWFGQTIDFDSKSILTDNEKQYLQNTKDIMLCVDPIWRPVDYIDEEGKHAGIGSFFIKDIEKSIGKKFSLVQTKTWDETINNIKLGKCDLVSLIQKTEQRSKYLNFTKTYFIKQSVLITKKNIPYIEDIGLLKDKKVGITKNSIIQEIITKNFENLKLVEYDNLESGMKAIEKGEIFGFVDLASTANLLIQNKGLDLKVSGITGIPIELSLGVKKDEKTLFSILEKALNNIDEATKIKYSNFYSNITYEKVTDYSLVWKILAISILFLMVFAYWNRKLAKAKQEIEKKNQELDKLLLIQSRQATFGTMIDTISHQWKQPLNELGLQMMHLDTQIRFEGKVPSKESLERTIEKSNHILEFMSKTIDIFRNFFKTRNEIVDVNISEVMTDTILFLDSTFEVENIHINKNIQPHIVIKAVEEEIAHAILNILVNAKDIFKSRDIDNPNINVAMYKKDSGEIVITIEDNGGGIEISPIEKIFEVNTSTKLNGGIGLFITKKVIEEKLNGSIKVKNGQDGAKFTIVL